MQAALERFDMLDVVDTDFMLGAWRGRTFASEHPLDHFLSNGIYEGRTAMGDGLWH